MSRQTTGGRHPINPRAVTIGAARGRVKVYDSDADKTNQRLIKEVEQKEQKIEHLNEEYSKLMLKLKEERIAKDEIYHDYQKLVSDLKRRSGQQLDQTLRDENDRLKKQLNKLNIENAELKTELDRVRTSLSKVAGEKMMEDNPYLTDLSDPNRPQRLAEKFNCLYDNSWTDAFECLEAQNMYEKHICQFLLKILEDCWKFCSEFSRVHFSRIQQILISPENESETNMEQIVQDSSPNNKLIRDTRRSFSRQFIPNLCQHYWKKIISKDISKNESLKPYVDDCLELMWYSAISDPPLSFTFNIDKLDDFRGYTQAGEEIDYLVWPAMYLYQYGPLLYQGVVQFKSVKKDT